MFSSKNKRQIYKPVILERRVFYTNSPEQKDTECNNVCDMYGCPYYLVEVHLNNQAEVDDFMKLNPCHWYVK